MARKAKTLQAFRSNLEREISEFLLDRKAILHYERGLTLWREFIISQDVNTTADVTPNHLADQSMNDDGRHNIYGAIRTFC